MIAVTAELTRFTYAWSLAHLPAVSIPCGLDAAGLPTGVQLAAAPWRDALVLRAGHAVQEATDWHRRRPPAFASSAPIERVELLVLDRPRAPCRPPWSARGRADEELGDLDRERPGVDHRHAERPAQVLDRLVHRRRADQDHVGAVLLDRRRAPRSSSAANTTSSLPGEQLLLVGAHADRADRRAVLARAVVGHRLLVQRPPALPHRQDRELLAEHRRDVLLHEPRPEDRDRQPRPQRREARSPRPCP